VGFPNQQMSTEIRHDKEQEIFFKPVHISPMQANDHVPDGHHQSETAAKSLEGEQSP
jgi:hypothetical protein